MILDQQTLFAIHCELYRIFMALNYLQKLHVPGDSEDLNQAITSLFKIKAILDEKEKELRLPLNVIQGQKSRGVQFVMENMGHREAV